jgi:hypothetical protein
MTDQGKANYEGYHAAIPGSSPVPFGELPYAERLRWDAGATSVELWLAEHPAGEDAAGTELATRYAKVEQMGYRSRVCVVSETELAGRKMLRLTVLATGTIHDISPDSIYEITWLTRAQAEQATRTGAHAPAAIGPGRTADDDDDPWRGDPLGDIDEDREQHARDMAAEDGDFDRCETTL